MGQAPHSYPRRVLTGLSLRRTLTAAHSLTSGDPHSPRPRGGLPAPLLVLGLSTALVAATTTVWGLSPWLAPWALVVAALLAAPAGFVLGTIAMTPFLVSTTRSGQGSPTGHQWLPPTALTFLACTAPLLSPLAPWCNTLAFWCLLGAATLISAYTALPALGRDIELDRARHTWDTDPH
ncbi:hypothetical protein [Nocardiopsis ganjiahuensis]|uniref:hypothetical protein n=1 Tax=Nocardiopsis ganjiahuensis TaxID=239984 RepID=UPI0003474CCF|nr:hypothetical protein [Nocardiopsis ganjiahuensis]